MLVAVSEIKTNQRDIKMRVAFIGAGAMCREHLAALSCVAGVTAVGIHSRTKSKAKELANDFGIPVVAETIGDLFTQTRADAVIIAVNEVAVETVFSAALSHDWLILVESHLGWISCKLGGYSNRLVIAKISALLH